MPIWPAQTAAALHGGPWNLPEHESSGLIMATRESMAQLHIRLASLRSTLRGGQRITRRQRGSLLVRWHGLGSSISCRSPGAPRRLRDPRVGPPSCGHADARSRLSNRRAGGGIDSGIGTRRVLSQHLPILACPSAKLEARGAHAMSGQIAAPERRRASARRGRFDYRTTMPVPAEAAPGVLPSRTTRPSVLTWNAMI